jgi:hypothetical protein
LHDLGIPEREEWPVGVLDEVAAFRQGDVVEELPLFYFADAARAVHARTRAYAAGGIASGTVVRFSEPAPYGIVTTQTCDLAQEGDRRPNSAWVRLAPVYNAESPHPVLENQKLVPGAARSLIKKGRDQFRMWLPKLADGMWIADLTLEVTCERGWLASKARIEVFTTDEERQQFSQRLAWLAARPAFDSRFVRAVQQPVIAALRELAKTDAPSYERMQLLVAEIGVRLDNRLATGQATLAILHSGIDTDLASWWEELWPVLYDNAASEGFNLFPLEILDLGQLSAAAYRSMTRVPLANLSPHPAWYGEDPAALPES